MNKRLLREVHGGSPQLNIPKWMELCENDGSILHRLIMYEPCVYCGGCPSFEPAAVQKRTIDHIIPRSKGGCNHWGNRAPSCSSCNYQKGNSGMLWWMVWRAERQKLTVGWRVKSQQRFSGAKRKGSSWYHWRRSLNT